jgi:hypothetical protein
MISRIRRNASSLAFVSACVAASLAIGVSTARSTNRAELLLTALLLGAACVFALTRPWVAAMGLMPVFLLPYSAMQSQTLNGLHVVPLLALFELMYGTAALAVARRNGVGTGPALLAVGALAVAGGSAEWLARGVPKDTIYTVSIWLGSLLLGYASSRFGQAAIIRLALCAAPLAALSLYEAFGRHNVWSHAVGPLIYEDSTPFRATSTFGHPLVAGTALVIVALMVLSTRHMFAPILGAILILGAGATLSRSPVLGATLGLAVLLLRRRRTRSHVLASVALVAIGIALALNVAPGIASSARARLFHSETSKTVRLHALHGFGDIARENPASLLLPQDRNRTSIDAIQGTLVDNQYVTLVYDYGFIAVVAAGLALAVAFRRHLRDMGAMLAAIVGALAMFVFFDGLYWPSTASLFWFAVGFATARHVRARSEGD